jgi:hypothetical protein
MLSTRVLDSPAAERNDGQVNTCDVETYIFRKSPVIMIVYVLHTD